MKLSIRYDLAFLDALVRFADNQVETQSNPDGTEPSPKQERQANQSMMMLCDMIDIFCGKRVAEARAEQLKKTEQLGSCE